MKYEYNFECFKLFIAKSIVLTTILLILIIPKSSYGLTAFIDVDQVLLFMETQPNNAFLAFDAKQISDVSRVNTVSELTDTDITLSADFTFMVDGVPFTGPGTWESTKRRL